jgi:uncharacterized protein
MLVVLDTNVWLSALLWGGAPDRILQLVEQGELQAIGSDAILDELATTLEKPKLKKRLQQLSLDMNAVMIAVRQTMVVVVAEPLQVPDLRDPKDEMIIAAAVAGQAAAIISGDKDLLILVAFQGIPIQSPRDFLETFSTRVHPNNF